MPFYGSYQQTFVTNAPALLASGKTVDSLAVGQVAILDGKTYVSTTTPTYATNKGLYFVWGTPNITLGDFGGMPNENEYTKLIKGKLIKGFRAKKAARGQTPVYTVGWSGDVSDTDTLFAKTGERKSLFIKLTGTIIDRLYDRQGVIKEFVTTPACIDDCTDTCASVLCDKLAYELADQINSDKDFSKFIRAKAIVSCTGVDAPSTTTCYRFALSVCDTGDQSSLGLVQSKYPSENVIGIASRNGATTTYTLIKDANTAPADYVGFSYVVPDCGTCPTGYTHQIAAKVFDVAINTSSAYPGGLPGFISHGTVTASGGKDHYVTLVNPTQDTAAFIAAVGAISGASATFTTSQKEACNQTTPTAISWVADGTLARQSRVYRITLADDTCGVNRLAALQAAYPALTVSVVDSSGSCVHTYAATVKSDCYEIGCAIDSVVFTAPAIFEGVNWVAVPDAGPAEDATCKCGLQLETSFFHRTTNECTFNAFPYENDTVHIQISNYNPDFNADPCEGQWAVKQIRQVQYPQGHGAYIQKLEEKSKAYDARTRSWDAVTREAQGYTLQADPNKFYDQYSLDFETKYFTAGGWSEQYVDSWTLNIYVPEGTGSPLEAAVNGYLASAGIEEEGVVLP